MADDFPTVPSAFRIGDRVEHGTVTLVVPGRAPREVLRLSADGTEYVVFRLSVNDLPVSLEYVFDRMEPREG